MVKKEVANQQLLLSDRKPKTHIGLVEGMTAQAGVSKNTFPLEPE
jgi:hypothetical protein